MDWILISAFVCGSSLAFAFWSFREGNSARKRLAGHTGSGTGASRSQGSQPRGEASPTLVRLLTMLAGTSANNSTGSVRDRLVQAGYRRQSALVLYTGARVALALGLALGVLVIPWSWSLEGGRLIAAVGLAAGVGFIAPGYFVDKRRKSRQHELRIHLPDALDLLVVCVEGGLSLTAGLARVANELTRSCAVLADELKLLNAEMLAGKTSTEALRALADRTGATEISSLVAMLIQTERFGTSVARALRIHCDSMRVRRLQRAEEAAQKAALKMIFPAALFIFPATIMVTVGPGMMQLMTLFEN